MLVPIGSVVIGHIVSIERVGLGFSRETADIALQMDWLQLQDGTTVSLAADVLEVENSRETVVMNHIQGIRSTGTLSHRASGVVGSLAFGNPIALIFTTAASASVLRFSNPEIYLPVEAELILRTKRVAALPPPAHSRFPAVARTSEERAKLLGFIRAAPFRTYTDRTFTPSDVTNLLFVGSRESIESAFKAANWVAVSELDARSAYKTVRSIAEDQEYRKAPMSTLLLGDRAPDLALAKTLDTFSKRHHLRIWASGYLYNGQPVWFSSSTHDVGIAFSQKQRNFIHQIDTNIDQERGKVVSDLVYTGCVQALNLVDRPWIPENATNGTGERLHTDKRIAVVELNSCGEQRRLAPVPELHSLPATSVGVRATRQTVLTFKNMLLRDNVIATTYSATRFAAAARRAPAERHSPELTSELNFNTSVLSSSQDLSLEVKPDESIATAPAREPTQRFNGVEDEPSVELGVHGGWTGYAGGNGTVLGYFLQAPDAQNPNYLLVLGTTLSQGWNIGGSVTLNTKQHLSQQINLNFDKSTLNLYFAALSDGQSSDATSSSMFLFQPAGLAAMEVGYNLQLHALPKHARLRPYAFAGPSLRVMHLGDAPVKKASPWFHLGLGTIGALTAAYQFGSTPPLEGGGLFQLGVQYGVGMTSRIAKRWRIRGEYRETLTRQPDFLSASKNDIYEVGKLPGYSLQLLGPYKEGVMRQPRTLAGIEFVF